METTIANTISELSQCWRNLKMESILKIQSSMQNLARDQDALRHLNLKAQELPTSLELYRDKLNGFILLFYSELQGTYRNPHDHGDAWVIYVVASGEIEMSNYFKSAKPSGQLHLVLKNREKLAAGDVRIYFPGEIHDTLCITKNATILRLTSTDLKEEEQFGRMHRYQK